MGDWLKEYGLGVYGTCGGPFKPGEWGASTCKGDKIYLFVMNWPEDGALVLPAIGQKITDAKSLSGGVATATPSGTGIVIDLPGIDRDTIATVIELTTDGEAFDIEPLDAPSVE